MEGYFKHELIFFYCIPLNIHKYSGFCLFHMKCRGNNMHERDTKVEIRKKLFWLLCSLLILHAITNPFSVKIGIIQ